jgi:hypothetical protein
MRTFPAAPPRSRRVRAMPLFRRPDGVLVKNETPVRSIMPYIMLGRNESGIYHEAQYDIGKTRAFLRAFNHQHENQQPATLFHLFLWSLSQAMFERPGLNRFVSGGRLYQRKGMFLSFAAKKVLDDEAPLVTVKVEFFQGEPFADCVKRIVSAISEGRTASGRQVDQELKLAMYLPGFVLRLIMGLWRLLDRVNLLPGVLIRDDPMYTTAFVANLGSVGLDRTFHHLYEYGTAALFAAIGTPRKQLMPDRAGTPVVRDILEVRWTLDERVNDGMYCSRALALLKRIFENPADYATGKVRISLDRDGGNGVVTRLETG